MCILCDNNDYHNIVDKAVCYLNKLDMLHKLHLTSVAKAIEAKSEGKKRIVFYGLKHDGFQNGILLTQEVRGQAVGCSELISIYEHFIFFPEPSGCDEKEKAQAFLKNKFSIAHELGHIALHDPCRVKVKKRKYLRYKKWEKSLFQICYEENQEIEADIFAAILLEQRPPRPCFESFKAPCLRSILSTMETHNIMSSKLKEIMPKKLGCVRSI